MIVLQTSGIAYGDDVWISFLRYLKVKKSEIKVVLRESYPLGFPLTPCIGLLGNRLKPRFRDDFHDVPNRVFHKQDRYKNNCMIA